jgi:hypothetical protein
MLLNNLRKLSNVTEHYRQPLGGHIAASEQLLGGYIDSDEQQLGRYISITKQR